MGTSAQTVPPFKLDATEGMLTAMRVWRRSVNLRSAYRGHRFGGEFPDPLACPLNVRVCALSRPRVSGMPCGEFANLSERKRWTA